MAPVAARPASCRLGLVPIMLVCAIASCLTPAPARGATASAQATVNVVSSLRITKNQDLSFGTVVPSGSGGTVVLAPAGARTVSGGVSFSLADVGRQAKFTVTGDSNATYAISLPASITIQKNLLSGLLTGPGSMVVDGFTSDPAGTGQLVSGTQVLQIGATLHVAANQVPGAYSGLFNVTVEYN